MAKRRKKVDNPRQGDLFGGPGTGQETAMRTDVHEGELELAAAVRDALSRDVTASGLSRYEIAGRMGKALRDDVTKTQIDAWTAESKAGWRFSLAYAPAWCWATGSERLVQLVAERLGLRVMTDEAAERAEIQRERENLRRRQAELRARERAVGGEK
jgi:hypothetical protein